MRGAEPAASCPCRSLPRDEDAESLFPLDRIRAAYPEQLVSRAFRGAFVADGFVACVTAAVQLADLATSPSTIGNSHPRTPHRSLRSLNKIEAQLVMHFLTANAIVRFAQCSQTLRSMANDPYAWRHAVLVCTTQQLMQSPLLIDASGIASRCASVSLDLDASVPESWFLDPPLEAQPIVQLLTAKLSEVRMTFGHCMPIGRWIPVISLAEQIRRMQMICTLQPSGGLLREIFRRMTQLDTLCLEVTPARRE